jgi:hypothetical protein
MRDEKTNKQESVSRPEENHKRDTRHVSDKIRSIDWFKKSFLDDKSAAGNLAITASRAVLREIISTREDQTRKRNKTHFLVTVIKSWVPKYTLKTPNSSSSVGFALVLGGFMNGLMLVAIEKLDIGLCWPPNPPAGKADGGALEFIVPKPIPGAIPTPILPIPPPPLPPPNMFKLVITLFRGAAGAVPP